MKIKRVMGLQHTKRCGARPCGYPPSLLAALRRACPPKPWRRRAGGTSGRRCAERQASPGAVGDAGTRSMIERALRCVSVMLQAITRLRKKKQPAKIAVMRDSTLAWPRTENSAFGAAHAQAAAFAALEQDDDDHRGGDADMDDQQHQPPIVQSLEPRPFRPVPRWGCPACRQGGLPPAARASSRFRPPWR